MTVKLFGVGKFNGIEGVASFSELKGFDKSFCFKVLEKFNDSFAGIHFCIVASVVDAAFGKNVVEG